MHVCTPDYDQIESDNALSSAEVYAKQPRSRSCSNQLTQTLILSFDFSNATYATQGERAEHSEQSEDDRLISLLAVRGEHPKRPWLIRLVFYKGQIQ